MDDKYIKVEMIFYNSGQHCRKTPPYLNERYRPHFIVKGNNEYLGVQFLDGEAVKLGKIVKGIAELVYDVDYSLLIPSVEFFIMEGANKVGEGVVLDRWSSLSYK